MMDKKSYNELANYCGPKAVALAKAADAQDSNSNQGQSIATINWLSISAG